MAAGKDTSVRGIFRDRRVQLAAAGVGGVGLVVLLMRRGGAGAPAGGGQTTIQPAAGLDSSSTDLYNAVQQLGQGWEQDIRDLTGALKSVKDQLPKTPTNPPPSTTPSPTRRIQPFPFPPRVGWPSASPPLATWPVRGVAGR